MASIDLEYQPPIEWTRLLAFLAARAAPSVESAEGGGYARTVRVGGLSGVIRAARVDEADDGRSVVRLTVSDTLDPVLSEIVPQVRRLLDLDANPEAIESHLAAAGLAPRERLRRGLRVPGAFDPFELAIRAILGQQVSVKGASTLMSRFTAAFGEPIATDHPSLHHLAATPERVAGAGVPEIRAIGIPGARAATIQALAREMAAGRVVIGPNVDAPPVVMRELVRLPGIGPWTAEYIAMRAMHWADAFPASDLVLRRNAGASTPAQLIKAAEAWRPWRAYAAMQLWSGINEPAA
jgi:AraC family transcriptional regulator of adaptative response / DNA-3-methyladenine glycosylase II